MKQPYFSKSGIVIAVLAALVTIIGLVTGWYFFFILWIPLGFLFQNNREN